jgi:regulator of protease activity HflC (stomatin/prohibitin superfamily)
LLILRLPESRTVLNSTLGDLILILASSLLLIMAIFSWRISQLSKGETSAMQVTISAVALLLWALAPIAFIFQSQALSWQTAIFVQLGLGLFAFIVGSLLLSQLVLPTKTTTERAAAFRRFFGRIVGEKGPITLIRYGLPIEAHDERERKDPGVILIDNASGAVLRTNTQFTRAVGPGLVFTEAGERIAEAVDLRLQARSIAGQSVVGTEGQIEIATSSLALTEDGIPVSADLKISFILHPGHVGPSRLGNKADLPPYEFNPSSAEGAVMRHTYTREQDVPWTEIPIRVVVDLWREYVKGWRLEDLLGDGDSTSQDLEPQFPLVRLQKRILERLSYHEPISGETGDRKWDSVSPEFDMLKSLGIKIVSVSITRLRVPEDVKAERLRIWRAGWAEGVQRNLQRSNQAVDQSEQQGQREAYQQMGDRLTRKLRSALGEGQKPGMRDTLKLVLEDAAALAVSDMGLEDGNLIAQRIQRMLDELETMDARGQGANA